MKGNARAGGIVLGVGNSRAHLGGFSGTTLQLRLPKSVRWSSTEIARGKVKFSGLLAGLAAGRGWGSVKLGSMLGRSLPRVTVNGIPGPGPTYEASRPRLGLTPASRRGVDALPRGTNLEFRIARRVAVAVTVSVVGRDAPRQYPTPRRPAEI